MVKIYFPQAKATEAIDQNEDLSDNFDELLQVESGLFESEKHLGDHTLWALPPGTPSGSHGQDLRMIFI